MRHQRLGFLAVLIMILSPIALNAKKMQSDREYWSGLAYKMARPVAVKAWEYLTGVALQKDGRVGYVQPIGERAIPGQMVDANSQANFGVGAFLLAACEYYRYLEKRK